MGTDFFMLTTFMKKSLPPVERRKKEVGNEGKEKGRGKDRVKETVIQKKGRLEERKRTMVSPNHSEINK